VTYLGRDESFNLEVAATDSLWVDDAHHEKGGERIQVQPGTTMVADAASRLRTADGADLRLRAGTEIRWMAPDSISLETGSIYVATEGGNHIEVRTPMGVVTDIGTRFMVTLDEGALEVAMRDGITEIATDHGMYVAQADTYSGDVVRVADHRISARSEPASDNRWSWIHEVHPGYSETGVADLLNAIATDLGLPLAFSSPAVKASIMSLQLDGDISGLAPQDALQVVLGTSGLKLLPQSEERLLIGFQSVGD
jgi:hypothetical protein